MEEAAHQDEHALFSKDDPWNGMLLHMQLQVHLARFHGKTVADVENEGAVPLLLDHDYAHRTTDVLRVERRLEPGVREALHLERERLRRAAEKRASSN
jgi:hypothetical protein